LTAGADSEELYAGHTPLTFACEMLNTSSMQILLEKKVNPNHLYLNTSCIGMMCNTRYMQSKMVKLLLENGADPNLGFSPLYGQNITCESVQLMLAYGLNINLRNKSESSLFSLIRYKNAPVLLMLLSMPNIDKTCKNREGQTLAYVITQIIDEIKFPDPPANDIIPSELSRWMLENQNAKIDMKNLIAILRLCMK
jgi:ankyrin repeat protein